ncbi:MAG: CPBP family intramembrane metalloprotease [Blastocatellia bacterium]|nr:CPBP family intramembrane metalloprotease [Blastocatellia bacterium]
MAENALNEAAVVRSIDPDRPHWGILAGIAVWLASVLAVVLTPSLFLIPYVTASGIKFTSSQQMMDFARTDPSAVIVQFAAIIPAHLLTILVAWVVVTRYRRFPFFETLGWTSGGVRWWHYGLLFVGFYAIAAVIGYYIPEQDNEFLRMLRTSRTAVYIVAIMATFSAPFIEEVVYRGVLYAPFRASFGTPVAVLLVTLIFTSVHVPQYLGSPATIFLLLLLSLGLSIMRAFSKSIFPCFVFHTLINASQSILLILEPYLKPPAEAAAVFIRI